VSRCCLPVADSNTRGTEVAEVEDPALGISALRPPLGPSPAAENWSGSVSRVPILREDHCTSSLKPLGGTCGDPCRRSGSTDLTVSTVGWVLFTQAP
jgi:hypothetical protein